MIRIFCLLALFCPLVSLSQSTPKAGILTGSVVSNTTPPVPLAGVDLVLLKSKYRAISGSDGHFTLTLRVLPDTLVVSLTGYGTARFVVTSAAPLRIELGSVTTQLEDVVVNTGYQLLPKERATGSFVKIGQDLLERRTSATILDRLENVTPGLIFNRNTIASSKNALDLSIRGHSTLFANDQPLVVVDNFPYDGDINNINPNDVESVTLLKDAAAASIWGVKAGNGVIVITTKKGRLNQKQSIDFTTNATLANRPNLFYNRNFLASSDFIDIEDSLFRRGFYDAEISSANRAPLSPVVEILRKRKSGMLSAGEAASQMNALRGLDVRNDLSMYLYRPSVSQQYALSLRGGNTASSYYLSAGYDKTLSNLKGNENSRTVLNGTYHFSKNKLALTVGFYYTQAFTQANHPGNITTGGPNSRNLYPYAQLADISGNALAIVKDYASAYADTAGAGKLLDWKYRPVDELGFTDNTVKSSDIRINAGITYPILPYLNVEIKYQYENAGSANRNLQGEQSYFTRNLVNTYSIITNGVVSRPIPTGGILDLANNSLQSNRLRAQLNYQFKWHKFHSLSAIAGSETSETITDRNNNRLYGYNDEIATNTSQLDYTTSFKFYFNQGRNARIPNPSSTGQSTDRYISYYTNAAYTYRSVYTLSASGRIDKSNLFGVSTNLRSVPLYSIGAAFLLSGTSFYKLSWLPVLKLRATYGYSGNIDKTLSGYTTALANTVGLYSRLTASNIINPGNPDLRWERVKMFNAGIDFSFRGNRISGSIEYYSKRGIDLIGTSPIAPSSGFTSFRGNTATTSGSGIDIVLNSINLRGKLGWQTQWILSRATDKVTSYGFTDIPGNYIINGHGNGGSVYPLSGKPIFGMYSYNWAGLDAANGDPLGYLEGNVSRDYTNILAKTTINNMVFHGSSRPTVFGSLRNSFTYKSFSLSFTIAYKLGYYFRRSAISYGSLYSVWSGHADYSLRWQKTGDELFTDVPSIQFPPVNNNRERFYASSSVLVEKADHIRFQDINLAYTHGRTRFFAYINNIGILWRANKKSLDPDLFAGNLPLPTSFSIGCNLNF